MEFLQHIDPSMAVIALVALCVLCLVLPVLLSGLHIVGAILGLIADALGSVIHLLGAGPGAWCGCLVAIGGCGLVAATAWLIASGLSNCATYPTNFCRLFGR